MTRLINWSTLLVLLGALGLALALGLWLMADLGQAEAQLDQLTANAGPDQTVTGSPPIMVEFDGSGTQPFTGSEVVSYQWYNEWGRLKGEGVSPVMKVFAEDHQPGQQRHFRLVVEDSQGNQAEDWVTIT